MKLSNDPTQISANQPNLKQIEQLKADNEFFGISSIFDQEMKKAGTITKKSKSLEQPKQKPTVNHFLKVAEAFVYPLMAVLQEPSTLQQPLLAGRILNTLSVLLELSANHWQIRKVTSSFILIFKLLANLVVTERLYDKADGYKGESLKTIQSQFKIGLALCSCQNAKWMSKAEREMITNWLEEQIEAYAEESYEIDTATNAIQSLDEPNQKREMSVKEVCQIAYNIVIKT